MKNILFVCFWIFLGITLLLGASYVLHNDIQYTSDVARDFLLLREISEKGIVLIGPSSTTKVFHGVLWMYLNYPVFWLSKGNPVASGWFWIALCSASTLGGFFVAKKLFTKSVAYFYVLLLAVFYAFHVRYLYNPDGVMLLIPFVFFFFVRYIQTKKWIFLLVHVVLLGALIQFEMAIGVPFTILSFLYIFLFSFRQKKPWHLFSFLAVPVMLSSFIIFDLRHQFFNTKLLLHFLTSASRSNGNILSMIWQRILYLSTSIEFFRTSFLQVNFVLFIIMIIGILVQIRNKINSLVYKTFLYYYIGFFILSLGNAGGLLYFYVYPLFPLVFLIFASLTTSRFKYLFVILILTILAANIFLLKEEVSVEVSQKQGKSAESWKSYNNIARKVFSGDENTFGYFVFDPDIVAYQPKYALFYQQAMSSKKVFFLEKKPVTYLIIAPNLYRQEVFWKEKLLHINSKPLSSIIYSPGYTIEKYNLEGEDLTTSIEPNIDPGLIFR